MFYFFTIILFLLTEKVYSQQQSEVCYNCQNSGCFNYGSCLNNVCSCHDGFGGPDCGSVLCGSFAQFNTSRPLLDSNSTSSCQCDKDWTGPNCNICQSNDVCSKVASLGTNYICNQSPVAWANKHFSSCTIKSPLITLAYQKTGYATIERNSIDNSLFTTVWLGNAPQFSCLSTSCSQNFNKNLTASRWNCASTKCTCKPGALMCGGSSTDISGVVNAASGEIKLECLSSTQCTLSASFLSSFFPSGISLNECSSGECVDSQLAPSPVEASSTALNTTGIIIISVACALLILFLIAIVLGLTERNRLRALPKPAPQPGATIRFEDICYRVKEKTILQNLSGEMKPGELLAIMGPSGSGKTTFLDILARKRKIGQVKGDILINENPDLDNQIYRQICGYVDQEDIHIPTLTVREVVSFSAAVRLPESVSLEEKKEIVDQVLKQLGLSHVADSRVGDASKRGLSGGEKKRLSVAVELVTDPAILFVDEPTSGLDSFSALQVIQTLSDLAKKSEKTIICTVHQPNSAIFNLFDKVLLLAKGKKVYLGPASESESFCTRLGFPCPPHYHIADHLLDVAVGSAAYSAQSPTIFAVGQEEGLRVRAPRKETSLDSPTTRLDSATTIQEIRVDTASRITIISQVFARHAKVFYRSPLLFFTHLGLGIVSGVFVGLLYFHVDNTIAGLQNRLGSFFFIQSLLAFGGLSAISSLDKDRVLFIRERSNGFYGWFPYYLSKMFFDIFPLRIVPAIVLCSICYNLVGYVPTADAFLRFLLVVVFFSINSGLNGFFIACMIPETGTATLVAVMWLLFQMLFSGILVNQVTLPAYIGWIQYISFFKYAYEALVANETSNLRISINVSGLQLLIPATSLLNGFGLDPTAYYKDMAVTLGLFLVFSGLIALLIKFKLKEKR